MFLFLTRNVSLVRSICNHDKKPGSEAKLCVNFSCPKIYTRWFLLIVCDSFINLRATVVCLSISYVYDSDSIFRQKTIMSNSDS